MPRFRHQVVAAHRINNSVVNMFRLIALVSICLLMPRLALAYVDPGTGSFVIQGIMAAVVGVAVAVKMFWHRIKKALGMKVDRDESEGDWDE